MAEENFRFFPTQGDFRNWLEENSESQDELWVAYFKKSTGKPSITWPESVDQALCFGWIDGLRRSINEECYTIRFTPRRKNSHWSRVNIDRIKELKSLGLVQKTGWQSYSNRDRKNSMRASYEQKKVKLDPEYEKLIRANKRAWTFYQSLSPYFKRASDWYIMSAKREDTRLRRLKILIDSSRQGLKIPPLRRS